MISLPIFAMIIAFSLPVFIPKFEIHIIYHIQGIFEGNAQSAQAERLHYAKPSVRVVILQRIAQVAVGAIATIRRNLFYKPTHTEV